MEEEKATLYTFKQPVRGGYYYIVIKASSDEEAAQIVTDIVGSLKHLTGRLLVMSQFPDGTLVLGPQMQDGLDKVGHVHHFVRIPLRPYHKRTGHKAFLPK